MAIVGFIAKLSKLAVFPKKGLTFKIEIITEAMKEEGLTDYAISHGYRALGNAYLLVNDFDNAINAFEKAVEAKGFTGEEGQYFPKRIEIAREQKDQFNRLGKLDKDALPLVRIPSMFPPNATKSGHCQMVFNVNEKGQTVNVKPIYCTQDVFEPASIKSVKLWKYNPKIENGVPVYRKNVESTVRYQLMNECGNIIPE